MDDLGNQQYTIEQLQQEYALSLSKAVEVLDRFGGYRPLIDNVRNPVFALGRVILHARPLVSCANTATRYPDLAGQAC